MKDTKDLFSERTDKDETSNVASVFNKKRIDLYTKARDEKTLLLGEKTVRMGIEADYNHLDFLLSIVKFRGEGTRLEDLTVMWGCTWEYLEPVINSFERLSNGFLTLEADNQEVMKEYGDQALELRIYKAFLKTQSQLCRNQFGYFKKSEELKQENTLAKIRKANESES